MTKKCLAFLVLVVMVWAYPNPGQANVIDTSFVKAQGGFMGTAEQVENGTLIDVWSLSVVFPLWGTLNLWGEGAYTGLNNFDKNYENGAAKVIFYSRDPHSLKPTPYIFTAGTVSHEEGSTGFGNMGADGGAGLLVSAIGVKWVVEVSNKGTPDGRVWTFTTGLQFGLKRK